MTSRQGYDLRSHEGHRVSVALVDGTRIDDCMLVSVGRGGAGSAWLAQDTNDLFIRWDDVVDVWTS
jgi:hypothetical protein